MSFQFVENSKINGAARKLIRSHVMKGKNIGKVRPRRIRPQQEDVRLSGNNSVSPPSDVSCNGRECHLVHVTSVPQAIGDTFSLSTLPYPLEPYERERIYQCMRETFLSYWFNFTYSAQFSPMLALNHSQERFASRSTSSSRDGFSTSLVTKLVSGLNPISAFLLTMDSLPQRACFG